MGSSELDKSSKEKEIKESKAPTPQEQPSATNTGTPDWAGFQAYSPMGPHGFLASSPQAHPYMWGVQHLMPPYGTPPHPYVAMYPPGGIYAHPSIPPGSYPFSHFAMASPNGIAEASVNTPGNTVADGKPSEGKEKLPIKRSKGSLGSLNMITGRNNEPGKTSGPSANGAYSKRSGSIGSQCIKVANEHSLGWLSRICSESGSDGSSEGSDANSQNESQMKSGHGQNSETSQNGNAAHGSQNGEPNTSHSMVNSMAMVPISAPGAPGGLPGPTTNLNIGMDYWGAAASPTVPAMHGKLPAAPVAGGMVTGGRDGVQSQLWLQDERELKRQRRKQSNRESARRSRLRKQAECDELAQHADALKEENASLRAELNRIRSEYDQLLAQNASLKERLGEVPGPDDPRSRRNEQQMGNDAQHSGQAEPPQIGQ